MLLHGDGMNYSWILAGALRGRMATRPPKPWILLAAIVMIGLTGYAGLTSKMLKQEYGMGADGSRELTLTKCPRDLALEKLAISNNERRKSRLQRECVNYLAQRTNRSLESTHYNHYLVDEKHKVIYCYAPKVGCTSWMRMLILLSGKYHGNPARHIEVHQSGILRHYGIRRLSGYSTPELAHRLSTYKKFMFVRDPYRRLVSVHRNKFLEKDMSFLHSYAPRIKRMFRKTTKGGRVRFHEFLQYLIRMDKKEGRSKPVFNPHWRPMHKLCHPCDVDFDFIGSLETIKEDTAYITSNLFNNACPPPMPSKKRIKATESSTADMFKNISLSTIEAVRQVYMEDFTLFGYDTSPPGH